MSQLQRAFISCSLILFLAILKDADLSKKVRQQIEEKLDVDLTERIKEVNDLVIECLQEKHGGGKKKKKAAREESEDGEEEEEEGSEEDEEEKKPGKRNPAKKTPNKRKKGSSDDEESASDDDASDEEYSPKKPKVTPKKTKPGKKGKKKKGGGYTRVMRAITLSPELAAVVGAEQMTIPQVVKKVWSIIKERNLYVSIICNQFNLDVLISYILKFSFYYFLRYILEENI
ncbi:PREDICTED: upstream activation factor subunit spp27-like [Vollenhovia emeryi]|uniref:upstream activation factor subunit spp27-like n=1 Tax=Vollenhovia emeryi TaxID=411798 RepID=UPI0005F3E2BB|nr:PREDICTED: upstream activation factor subunit spp27-like [Vollenhovia emeryi]